MAVFARMREPDVSETHFCLYSLGAQKVKERLDDSTAWTRELSTLHKAANRWKCAHVVRCTNDGARVTRATHGTVLAARSIVLDRLWLYFFSFAILSSPNFVTLNNFNLIGKKQKQTKMRRRKFANRAPEHGGVCCAWWLHTLRAPETSSSLDRWQHCSAERQNVSWCAPGLPSFFLVNTVSYLDVRSFLFWRWWVSNRCFALRPNSFEIIRIPEQFSIGFAAQISASVLY